MLAGVRLDKIICFSDLPENYQDDLSSELSEPHTLFAILRSFQN